MTTVPNWIAKGYAYDNSPRGDSTAYPIKTWRATNTQVVVTLDGLNGEFRFYLDDLRYVGRTRNETRWSMTLLPPDDDRVRKALDRRALRTAVNDLRGVIADTRLDPSSMDAEALLTAIGRIQRAATKAMADLAEVL